MSDEQTRDLERRVLGGDRAALELLRTAWRRQDAVVLRQEAEDMQIVWLPPLQPSEDPRHYKTLDQRVQAIEKDGCWEVLHRAEAVTVHQRVHDPRQFADRKTVPLKLAPVHARVQRIMTQLHFQGAKVTSDEEEILRREIAARDTSGDPRWSAVPCVFGCGFGSHTGECQARCGRCGCQHSGVHAGLCPISNRESAAEGHGDSAGSAPHVSLA